MRGSDVPKPLTELSVETDKGGAVITTHDGVCKAVNLNQTAFRIWQFIDGKTSLKEIVSRIHKDSAKANELDPKMILSDVTQLMDELVDLGAVEID